MHEQTKPSECEVRACEGEAMTRKEKKEAAEKKRADLHLEFMICLQDSYKAALERKDNASDALHTAVLALDHLVNRKAKACPQEKAMVYEVVDGLVKQLKQKLEAAKSAV